MTVFYAILCLIITIFSYGFIDPNLTLSGNPFVTSILNPLRDLVYTRRVITAGIFLFLLASLFILYVRMFLRNYQSFPTIRSFMLWTLPFVVVLTLSYPMLSYDLFNYMATAKVTYTYRENPYIVMPIEISNDPNLAFTRAANKVALYGPTWISLTSVPHTLGMGNVWRTIIAFKLLTAGFYLVMCVLIWYGTKSMRNVIFFALNPLIMIEVLVSGHNDIVMMVLAIGGILLWQKKRIWQKTAGILLLGSSFFVKGATVVFLPLLFFRKLTQERLMFIATCLLFAVFIIVAPLREELYPWYAVWFLSTISFLPYKTYGWLWGGMAALSLGLELRHVPYMVMGYYEGPGPMLRTILTVIPVGLWCCYLLYKRYTRHT